MRTGWLVAVAVLATACGSVTGNSDAGTDGGGNSDGGGDTTPPETTLTLAPTATGPSATFTMASSEANSTFQCAVDSTTLADCDETITLTGLATGSHIFRAAATDAAGNTDPTPVEHTFISDASGPPVTITSPVANSTVGTSVTLSFTTDANAVTTCQLDGQAVIQNCASGQVFSGLTSATTHMVTVTATDSLGNTGMATSMFTVDDQGPSLTFSGAPTNGSTINLASVAITFNIVPANEPATFTFECRFTGDANFSACTNFNKTGLIDQAYSLQVRATDRFGNTGPTVTTGWTVAPLATTIFAIRTTPIAVGTRVRITTNVRVSAKTADRFWCQEAITANRGITVASSTANADAMMVAGRAVSVTGTVANPSGNLTLVDATYTAGALATPYAAKDTNRDSVNVLLEANEGMLVNTGGTAFRQAGACAAPNFCIRSCFSATPLIQSVDASGMVIIDDDHFFDGILEGTAAATYRYRVTEATSSSDACL